MVFCDADDSHKKQNLCDCHIQEGLNKPVSSESWKHLTLDNLDPNGELTTCTEIRDEPLTCGIVNGVTFICIYDPSFVFCFCLFV